MFRKGPPGKRSGAPLSGNIAYVMARLKKAVAREPGGREFFDRRRKKIKGAQRNRIAHLRKSSKNLLFRHIGLASRGSIVIKSYVDTLS